MWRRSEGPRPLREVLSDLARRHDRVDFDAPAKIFDLWESVVGPAMAGHCHPEGVVDGILRVRTPGGAWAARLRENEKTIVEQLTELSGAQVTALHLVQGS